MVFGVDLEVESRLESVGGSLLVEMAMGLEGWGCFGILFVGDSFVSMPFLHYPAGLETSRRLSSK